MIGTENDPASMRSGAYDWRRLYDLISDLLAKSGDRALGRSRYDFSRDGALSPQLLVVMLLYMVADAGRRGYGLLLESFWQQARLSGLRMPVEEPVSATAFCNARLKITCKLLSALLEAVYVSMAEYYGGTILWHGRRLLAIDATKINTRRSSQLSRAYGVPAGGHCPQVMVTTLYDVGARVPISSTITRHNSNEREQLRELLPFLRPGDVLLADMGYPSFEVFDLLVSAKVDFLIRVPTSSTFEGIDVLMQSGGNDYRLVISSPDRKRHLELRGIRALNPKGEDVCFISTLKRCEFTAAQLAETYRLRWQEEEFFKAYKSTYLGPNQFHSTKPGGVAQEIHAGLLFWVLTRYLMLASGREHDIPHEQISPKAGALALAEVLVPLFFAADAEAIRVLTENVLARLSRARHRPRPGRSFPRRSFLPSRKWGPQGRRGGHNG